MNLVQKAVEQGGKLAPIAIPGTFGGMNPSVFIDSDGDILVNVRVVNYILYHSENKQLYPSLWGPLAYLHPEKDQRLVTENYLVRLNSDLAMTDCTKVEMLQVHEPIWEFVGLEDARIAKWDDKYYLIGVRRDTTPNGVGRMELSEIALDKQAWSAREVCRTRIPAPGKDNSYCEKNWMPILDKPYHFVKWSSPVEVVKVDPYAIKTEQVSVHQGIQPPKDQRGGSQLIRWGNYYIAITHEVNLFKNYLNQKDGIYRHRLCVYNDHFNLVGLSQEFSFLDFRIEFCVGAAEYHGDLLISFAVADNAAFVLRTPKAFIDDLVAEALNA
jgi:hypothetical protein